MYAIEQEMSEEELLKICMGVSAIEYPNATREDAERARWCFRKSLLKLRRRKVDK